MKIRTFLNIFLLALKESIRDRADGLAAAVAYFQLLSIPPFVALMVIFSNKIFGEANAKAEIYPVISDFFHPQFVQAIRYMIEYSLKMDDTKVATISFIAMGSLLYGTFSYFEQIKDCIETFWDVRRERFGIKAKLAKKRDALLMAVVVFGLLMTGFVLRYHIFPPGTTVLFLSGKLFIETLIIFLIALFFLTYCPPVKIKLREVLPGTLITTFLYMGGRLVMGHLLHNRESEAEDVTAAILMYLLWAYYSSLIFLYCAEFSRIYIESIRKLNRQN
jgi:membrane protein